MWKRRLLCCALLCAGLAGCRGKPAGEITIPPEEVNRKNPIEPSPSAIAEGKRLYGSTDCAMCHGKQGDGKGVLAKDINMKTRNWLDPAALTHFTDGELFYIIAKGKGRMPGYANRETSEQVWQIVDYVRSIPGN
jgi:mono/diheme cytochrome c family protein